MRTDFPTTDIVEYSWYIALCAGPEYIRRPRFFHYTNLDNLSFILKEDCLDLRLTRADCFMDKQEMLHIVPILEEVSEELLQKGDIDGDFYGIINEDILKAKMLTEEFRKYYVFSFSANEASSHLKEHYACKDGKDGVIIGVRALALEDMLFTKDINTNKVICGMHIYDVFYNREELKNGFCETIKLLYGISEKTEESDKAIKRTVNALIQYSLVYKPASFAHEEETRLIVDMSSLTLSKEKFYQDDDRYLHILLPKESLYNTVEITKKR